MERLVAFRRLILESVRDFIHLPPDRFPEATLDLLRSLVEEDAALRRTKLPDILSKIRSKGIDLDDSSRDRQLQEAAGRG